MTNTRTSCSCINKLGGMITEWHIERKGEALILGIAVADTAVLDIVTDHPSLVRCLQMLESPHVGMVDTQMGRFGEFPITLVLGHDETVSIMVDGPDFHTTRNQSAGIWVEKDRLREILREVTNAA
jgi:hypothetical protein